MIKIMFSKINFLIFSFENKFVLNLISLKIITLFVLLLVLNMRLNLIE